MNFKITDFVYFRINAVSVSITDEETLMIASASEDCYIRIWKIVSKTTEVEKSAAGFLKVDEATFSTLKGIQLMY